MESTKIILIELIKHFNYIALDSKKRYNLESIEYLENLYNYITKDKIKSIYMKHKNFTKSHLELKECTVFMKNPRLIKHTQITSQDLHDELVKCFPKEIL